MRHLSFRYSLVFPHAPFGDGAVLSAAATVWALLLGIGFLMLGNGLQGILLGVRASAEGFSATVTGFIMTGYFGGFLVGSRIALTTIRRVGHLRVFAAASCFAAIAILIQGLFVDPVTWAVMRVVTGYSMASAYIVTESWLNDRVDNEHRASLLAVYMVVTYMGMASGQLLLNAGQPTQHDLFMLASVLISFAAIPILFSVTPQPRQENAERLSLVELYRVSPLGLVGTFISGILQGTLSGMGAVYARAIGLTIAQTSYFMFFLILGAAVLQWPFGKISDRFDRRKVIAGLALFGALISMATHIVHQLGPGFLIAFAPVLGAGPYLLYSLLIAYTNDHLRRTQMVAASSALILTFGLGAAFGPPTAGILMDSVGPQGYLWLLAVFQAGIFGFALYRMTRRESLPVEAQSSCRGAPALSPPSEEWTRKTAPEQKPVEPDVPLRIAGESDKVTAKS